MPLNVKCAILIKLSLSLFGYAECHIALHLQRLNLHGAAELDILPERYEMGFI